MQVNTYTPVELILRLAGDKSTYHPLRKAGDACDEISAYTSATDNFPGPEAAIISNPPMMPMFFKNCVCIPPAAIPWAAQKLCSNTLTTPR